MLIPNLAGLSDAQVRKLIWTRCKLLGRVRSVSIHRRMTSRTHAFALVDMSSVAEVKKVIRSIGDSLCGGAALIRLLQDVPSAQSTHVGMTDRRPRETAQVCAQSQRMISSWLAASAAYFRREVADAAS